MDTPISLGGSNSFEGLAERTEEMTEDIEERQSVLQKLLLWNKNLKKMKLAVNKSRLSEIYA